MAVSPNLIGGEASLTVDGVAYLLRGSFKYSPSLVKRETKIGQDKVHGVTEMPVAPYISCLISDTGGLAVQDFNAMVNVSISAELANGKSIVGSGMWTVDVQEVDTEEGQFEVKWEGLSGSVVEQTS